MNILGIRVDNLERKEILEKIESFLDDQSPSTIPNEKVLGKFHQIATVNPEFILEAHENPDFRNVLNMCDLNVADGIGIRFAFWKFGQKLKCRFAGADLVHEILKIAEKKNLAIFLAINKEGLSSFTEIKKALLKIYPDLKIDGADLDPSCHSGLDPESRKILKQVQDDKNNIKIIFCNFGAPKQEIFLNSIKNDNIRLAMGVGGTFDFVTGKVKRAPFWMRKIGLEWLWRLFRQPKRIKRILNAVMVFPCKIIFDIKK